MAFQGFCVRRSSDSTRRCMEVCRDLFAAVGSFSARPAPGDGVNGELTFGGNRPRRRKLAIVVRERITPQIAADVFQQLRDRARRLDALVAIYAPTISPRVAQLARDAGVSFVDAAGNCRIVDQQSGLFIERTGHVDAAACRKQRASNAFAPKSSRIIRVMLHEPLRRWQVGELAGHPDVGVSLGLAAKVKQWLIREHYAGTIGRSLVLTRPTDLLEAWAATVRAPTAQHGFYLRGEPNEIEVRIASWCQRTGVRWAFARLSAAWRLVPEIRSTMASIYIEPNSLEGWEGLARSLREDCGAVGVDSGATLTVLEPFDDSVFVRASEPPAVFTSPLQTYIDLRHGQGRGAEAAQTIFDRFIRPSFEDVEAERRE